MPKFFLLVPLLAVTGCGTMANIYDRSDPCQSRAELNRPQGYQIPNWCGASTGRSYIYRTPNGQPLGSQWGYIKGK